MFSDKQITHISKFLNLVLRHQPDLEIAGWKDAKYKVVIIEDGSRFWQPNHLR